METQIVEVLDLEFITLEGEIEANEAALEKLNLQREALRKKVKYYGSLDYAYDLQDTLWTPWGLTVTALFMYLILFEYPSNPSIDVIDIVMKYMLFTGVPLLLREAVHKIQIHNGDRIKMIYYLDETRSDYERRKKEGVKFTAISKQIRDVKKELRKQYRKINQLNRSLPPERSEEGRLTLEADPASDGGCVGVYEHVAATVTVYTSNPGGPVPS